MNIFPLQHDEKNKIKLLEEIEVKEDEEEQELPPKLNWNKATLSFIFLFPGSLPFIL